MKVKTVVFDFDGTIANTFEALVDIFNKLSPAYGLMKITKNQIDYWRKKPSKDVLKDLKISPFKLPFLIRKIKKELDKEISKVSPTVGLRRVLSSLKKHFELGILTSNSESNVDKFLRRNKLNLFDFIYTQSGLFSKNRAIRTLLKKRKLKPEELIFVGDETRDIEAARDLKVPIIAVGWGFNSSSVLRKYKPDFLVDKPQSLFKVLMGLK